MSYLSSLYNSPQKQQKNLPSVQSMITLNSSNNIYGKNTTSFVCEENLQESPSTSNSSFPLREIQPILTRPRNVLNHVNSEPNVRYLPEYSSYHHYQYSQRQKIDKRNLLTYQQIQESRKRKLIEQKLTRPQKQYVCAKLDKLMLTNNENLLNLIKLQNDYLPDFQNMLNIQTEITLNFRKSAVQWLEDVCNAKDCDVVIFPLAINFMDRFLSKQFVPKINLQALASSCLLLAGKMKAPIPLTIHTIADFTDGAVTEEELIDWEILVISTLNWQFCCPTAFEFLDQFLTRSSEIQKIREPFLRICYKLQQEASLSALKPSLQAMICAGFAAIEIDDYELYDIISDISLEYFNVPNEALWTGVNHIAKLFDYSINKNTEYNIFQHQDNLSNIYSIIDSDTEDFHILPDDEGSPRKIRKISEEPEDDNDNDSDNNDDDEKIVENLSISNNFDIKTPKSTTVSLCRSKSAIINKNNRNSLLSIKSLSTTSLRRSSISDDSGFHSEISSPDITSTTTTTTVIAQSTILSDRKLLKSPKKLSNKKHRIAQKSERLLNFFK